MKSLFKSERKTNMEAPDKIYLMNYGSLGISAKWNKIPLDTTNYLIKADNIEYIHKDALLEWLNNEVERYNDKLIQPSNSKEEAIQIASSISSLLGVIAKVETL